MNARLFLIFAALAAAAPPSTAASGERSGRGGARQTACEKGCIAPHDSSAIGCKLFKTPEQSEDCLASAQEKRARCERACRMRAQERARVKSERERERRAEESRQPTTIPAD